MLQKYASIGVRNNLKPDIKAVKQRTFVHALDHDIQIIASLVSERFFESFKNHYA